MPGGLVSARRAALASFGASLLLIRAPGLANAQTRPVQSGGIGRRTLERHELPGSDQDLTLIEITFPPGVAAPLHHHPVPGLNYIVSGTAESAYDAEQPRTYRAGDSLQDLADVPHTLFRNPDEGAPLQFLISYVLGRDQPYTLVP